MWGVMLTVFIFFWVGWGDAYRARRMVSSCFLASARPQIRLEEIPWRFRDDVTIILGVTSFFLVAAPLKMVFPKKGSLFSQGH